jgi:hypothetical protein
MPIGNLNVFVEKSVLKIALMFSIRNPVYLNKNKIPKFTTSPEISHIFENLLFLQTSISKPTAYENAVEKINKKTHLGSPQA